MKQVLLPRGLELVSGLSIVLLKVEYAFDFFFFFFEIWFIRGAEQCICVRSGLVTWGRAPNQDVLGLVPTSAELCPLNPSTTQKDLFVLRFSVPVNKFTVMLGQTQHFLWGVNVSC